MSSNPNDIDSLPPIWPSQKFNTYLFQGNNYLTRQQADLLYASVYSIRNIAYINDVTPGIASPNKVLILDSSNNITGINNLSGSGAISYAIINANTYLLAGSSVLMSALTSITTGTASASKALVLDSNKDITSIRNLSATNLSGTLQTASQPNITSVGSLTGLSMQGSISMNGYNLSLVNAFSASGILTLTNTTSATNNSNGAIQMTGGLSISNLTDATSSTNGGSITTAGGVAIAKKLYVGTDLSVGGNITGSGNLTLSGSLISLINANITDSGIATIVYPLTISHLLSSGTPTNNSFGIGQLFNGPNSSGSTISYGRIYALCTNNTAGAHAGNLIFSTVFGGNFIDTMTLSSTSASASKLTINGSASNLTCFSINNSIINLANSGANPSITMTCGANNLCQHFYTTDSTTFEIGVRGSTSPIPNASGNSYYIYNGSVLMSMTSSGVTKFLNSSTSLIGSSNSMQLEGGLFVNKQILFNSYIASGSQMTGNRTSSVNLISLYDNPILFRNQNGGDFNHGIAYSGNGNSSWNSGNGFGNNSTYKVDGPILWGNAGVNIGSLNASTETIIANFTKGGTTILSDNFYFANTSYFGTTTVNSAKVNIQSFGSQLGLVYNSTAYTTAFAGLAYFQLSMTNTSAVQPTQTYSLFLDVPSPVAGSTTTHPRMSLSNTFNIASGNEHRLDMGDVSAKFIIQIYNPNTGSGRNGSPSSGLGASNNAITYTSSLINGHYFYSSYGLSGVGANTSLGNYLGRITKDGNIESNSGLRATGYNPVYTGSGAEIHYASNIASFFGYDRSSMLYKTTQLGSSLFVNGTTGYVSIGVNDGSKAPLYVTGTFASSYTGSYGWLNNGGAGGSSNFTNRQFSARFTGALFCESGEINCASDIRFKDNIKNISDELAINFIKKIDPIEFKYKNSDITHYGYSAQDLMKENYNVIVGSVNSDEPLEEQTLTNDKGDTITIPKDTRLIVNMMSAIPLLHKTIKLLYSRIEKLEELVNVNDTRLDEVIDYINSE